MRRHDDAKLWSGRDRSPALVRRPSGGRDQTRVFDSRHEAWCAHRNEGGNFRRVISDHVKLSDCRLAFKLIDHSPRSIFRLSTGPAALSIIASGSLLSADPFHVFNAKMPDIVSIFPHCRDLVDHESRRSIEATPEDPPVPPSVHEQ